MPLKGRVETGRYRREGKKETGGEGKGMEERYYNWQ